MARPDFRIEMPARPTVTTTPSRTHLSPDEHISPRTLGRGVSPRISPWPGSITSPGITVAPEAVDYFHQQNHTGTVTSTRALTSLGLVAGGRITMALGLAGVSTGFKHGQAHPYVLGALGIGAGFCLSATGITRSYNDTACLNVRRARVSAAAATLGALMVAGGGVLVSAGHGKAMAVYEGLPLRAVGNFLVYGAIPNAFSAAEIVHGDSPIHHRVLTRDLTMALSGMFLMTWAHISTPTPPAPLWAREASQCAGIVCLAVSGALARTDTSRAQSNARASLHTRRKSSAVVAR